MVGVTVALSALTATFVFQFDNVSQNAAAQVDISQDGTTTTVRLIKNENVDSFKILKNQNTQTENAFSDGIGSTESLTTSSGDTVTVIANVGSGSQVLRKHEVD